MSQLQERAMVFGFLAVLGALFACGRLEPKSSIVETVEQAGSGSLSAVSKDGIRDWLGKHRELASQVDVMCKPVRQKATAHWDQSTEGRLCAAAHELSFWRSGPVTSDDKKYLPGLK